MVLLLDFGVDEIAVLDQFTDQRIDLTQAQLWATFKKAADESVFINPEIECCGTSILDRSDTILSCQREHAKNAANADIGLMPINGFTECANVSPGAIRTC